MSKMDDLSKKGEEITRRAAESKTAVEKQKTEYLSNLKTLYENIAKWLTPLISKGQVKIGSNQAQVTVKWDSGNFVAPTLSVSILNQTLVFRPSGIGLVSVSIDGLDHTLATRDNAWTIFDLLGNKYTPLDEDSFAGLIEVLFRV